MSDVSSITNYLQFVSFNLLQVQLQATLKKWYSLGKCTLAPTLGVSGGRKLSTLKLRTKDPVELGQESAALKVCCNNLTV